MRIAGDAAAWPGKATGAFAETDVARKPSEFCSALFAGVPRLEARILPMLVEVAPKAAALESGV